MRTSVAILRGEVHRSPDVVLTLLVELIEPAVGPAHLFADNGIECVVGAQGDDESVDAAVVAVPHRGVELGGSYPERGEDRVGGDVVVGFRFRAEEIVLGRLRGERRGAAGGRRHGVAEIPAVHAEVLVAHVGRRWLMPGATLPVVLVGVEQPLQLGGQLELLEQAQIVAELLLQLPSQRLEVQRQAVERATVTGHREPGGPNARGDLRRPRQVGAEHSATGDPMRQRVTYGDEDMRRIGGHDRQVNTGSAQRLTDGRVGDRIGPRVGDDDIVRSPRIKVFRWQHGHVETSSARKQ